MKITKRQLRRIIREVIDNPVRGSMSADDIIAQSRESDRRLGLPDEGPHEDLITALQRTWAMVRMDVGISNPSPQNMRDEAFSSLGIDHPDEAKELMAMSPNKQDNILAMAFPEGY